MHAHKWRIAGWKYIKGLSLFPLPVRVSFILRTFARGYGTGCKLGMVTTRTIRIAGIICWCNTIILFWAANCAAEPPSDAFCNSRWQAYSRCVQMELLKLNHPVTGLPRPNDTRMLNIQISDIRACFKEHNCKDPLAPEASSRARGVCFPSTLDTVRNDLEGCVKKDVSNFFLPQDEYSSANEVYRVMFLTSVSAMENTTAYCPSSANVDAATIRRCLAEKAAAHNYDGATTPAPDDSPQPPSYCDVVRKCKMLSSMMTDECNEKWNALICPCTISQLFPESMAKYKNQYADCVTSIGIKNFDKNNDVAFQWFEASLYAFCGDTPSNESTMRGWTPGDKSCGDAISSSTSTTTTQQSRAVSSDTEITAEPSPDSSTLSTASADVITDQITDQEGNNATTTTAASVETTTRPILPWPKFLEDLGIPNPFSGFVNPFSNFTDKLFTPQNKTSN